MSWTINIHFSMNRLTDGHMDISRNFNEKTVIFITIIERVSAQIRMFISAKSMLTDGRSHCDGNFRSLFDIGISRWLTLRFAMLKTVRTHYQYYIICRRCRYNVIHDQYRAYIIKLIDPLWLNMICNNLVRHSESTRDGHTTLHIIYYYTH